MSSDFLPRFAPAGKSLRTSAHPPACVLQKRAWPAWRRWFDRPPAPARARVDAWAELTQSLDRWEDLSVPFWPDAIGQGIFGDSITRVDFLDAFASDVPLTLEGRVATMGGLRRVPLTCPHGRLALAAKVQEFDFDITEVQAIAASKSSDRFFESVRSFGQDFVQFKATPVDAEGLATMLAHGEVRLVHGTGADAVSLRLWDGRLVLKNDGGSHHFAGAAYIAESIGARVPLRAPLTIATLNERAVAWLVTDFVPLAVPDRTALHLMGNLARLIGACYELRVPDVVCTDARVLLLPGGQPGSAAAVDVLLAAGAVPLTPWFEDLLARQARHRRLHSARFGARIALPDSERLERD